MVTALWLITTSGLQAGLSAQSATPGKTSPTADLDRAFRAAVAHYDAHEYAEARQALGLLLARVPNDFEVNELAGLVNTALGDDAKANLYLAKAVRLQPGSAPARGNLAANLVRLDRSSEAEAEFKKAVELDPASYDTNHNLGEFYAQAGQIEAAIRYLERAQQVQPTSYDNGYDLALAYTRAKRFGDAKQEIQALLRLNDAAELHNLLGEVNESAGDPIAAVNEYERAAHLDPSEQNLFDWGSELLSHETLEPAIQVFQQGVRRYPRSVKLQIGYGISLYARGHYGDAVKTFSAACDLTPRDPRPYLFLARAYNIAPSKAEEVKTRLRRFLELDPANGEANYYYAMSLWKGQNAEGDPATLVEVKRLLERAISLSPGLADAHLQLGVLNADQHDYAVAIREYQETLKLDPNSTDAHYRLGQAYVRAGEKALAQQEFAVYNRLHQDQVAENERRRNEIKMFVYTMKQDADR